MKKDSQTARQREDMHKYKQKSKTEGISERHRDL